MYVSFHLPMFGTPHVDAKPMECPVCPRGESMGANDWKERDISTCNPGDKYECVRCGTVVEVMWGLDEPDHLSNWMNSEYCPHRLCKLKFTELNLTKPATN